MHAEVPGSNHVDIFFITDQLYQMLNGKPVSLDVTEKGGTSQFLWKLL